MPSSYDKKVHMIRLRQSFEPFAEASQADDKEAGAPTHGQDRTIFSSRFPAPSSSSSSRRSELVSLLLIDTRLSVPSTDLLWQGVYHKDRTSGGFVSLFKEAGALEQPLLGCR